MDLAKAISVLDSFSGQSLTRTLSEMELTIQGSGPGTCAELQHEHHVGRDSLAAAGLVKRRAGQIDVIIHALGILQCLPEMLQPDELVESVFLGAGNTGKRFDLETNRRVAEFKFIAWRGGSEAIRQNSLFKDFYGLAEHDSPKSKHLYVLGTEHPLRFPNGQRAINSVLSRNAKILAEFRARYPEYQVVRDYYLPRRDLVAIEDVTSMLPGLARST